jgi:hypothetical protein
MKELEKFIEEYRTFIVSDEWQKWMNENKDRIAYYSNLFKLENLDKLTDDIFIEIFKNSWAASFWKRKDYKAEQILKENGGIDKIKNAFKDLFYANNPLSQRYDEFRRQIKGLGASFITEIMAFEDPDKYCIWNLKPKKVLPLLKLDYLLPARVFRSQLTGEDYQKCIDALSKIREALKVIMENPNFINVDEFIFFIFLNRKKFGLEEEAEVFNEENINEPDETLAELKSYKEEKHVIVSDLDEDIDDSIPTVDKETRLHTKAQYLLVEIGNLLGYDTYVPPEDFNKKINGITLGEKVIMKDIPPFTNPRLIDKVKHIDVIWFREEFPEFCFEVEDSTDVTKGLLRLYQIRQLNAKLIIVGPKDRLRKFEKEINNDPFYFIKDKYRFISYEELENFFKTTVNFVNMKNKLFFDENSKS